MKNDAKKGGDRFDKLFEVQAFDPENSEHNKIVQKRINMMMHSPLMVSWINESIWFGKDEELTFEVTKFNLVGITIESFITKVLAVGVSVS